MKVLPPQRLTEKDYASIRQQIFFCLKTVIFDEIVKILSPHNEQMRKAAKALKNSKELRNDSQSPLVSGIYSGKIQYVDGVFSGDFSAPLSHALKSAGAKFNKQRGTFALPPQDVPMDVLEAVNTHADTAKDLHEALDKKLVQIGNDLEWTLRDHPIDASGLVETAEQKFNKVYGETVGPEELSDRAKRELAKDYNDSIHLPILDFSKKMVQDLRAIVSQNSDEGYRFDRLVPKIEDRYAVTKSKAEFLAENESSIYMAKHHEERFSDAGISEYVWDTSGDAVVRPDHAALDGQKFRFDTPPIVDHATGRRANPGEDYRCRCVARPVVPVEEFANAA